MVSVYECTLVRVVLLQNETPTLLNTWEVYLYIEISLTDGIIDALEVLFIIAMCYHHCLFALTPKIDLAYCIQPRSIGLCTYRAFVPFNLG